MIRARRLLRAMLRCESGLTYVEYALLIALISMGLVVTFEVLGDFVEGRFFSVNSDLQNAI